MGRDGFDGFRRDALVLARSLIGNDPRVYYPLMRRRLGTDYDGLPHLVDAGTEVVIEGYPRSANTFAIAAFRLAQRRRVQLAHHAHVPAQAREGLRRGLPVVVLVRRPDEAVTSMAIRAGVSIETALRVYVRFHAAVTTYAPEDRRRAVPDRDPRLRCGHQSDQSAPRDVVPRVRPHPRERPRRDGVRGGSWEA